MNDDIRCQLSALMDGELPSDQARFLLKRVQGDPALRAEWARWHQLRDCLQGHAGRPLGDGLGERIAAALAQDPPPARGLQRPWLRYAGGLAIAASVALAALLVVPVTPVAPGGSVAMPSPVAQQPAAATPSQVVSSGLSESDLRPSLAPVTQTVAASRSTALAPAVRLDPRVDGWLIRHGAVVAAPIDAGFVPLLPASGRPLGRDGLQLQAPAP